MRDYIENTSKMWGEVDSGAFYYTRTLIDASQSFLRETR